MPELGTLLQDVIHGFTPNREAEDESHRLYNEFMPDLVEHVVNADTGQWSKYQIQILLVVNVKTISVEVLVDE